MPQPSLRYLVYDVFTDQVLSGNPLAVVLDAQGLDSARMQAIAAEFNLSETVFVLPPVNPMHTASIRIFTPRYEMPFAGHPTVGTAVALAAMRDASESGDAAILVLEEKIGDVRCMVSAMDGSPFGEFDLPQLSQPLPFEADPAVICAALGLDRQDIGFENHTPAAWSAGVPYVTVPVSGLEAAGRARIDVAAWRELAPLKENGVPASAYVYCRETTQHDSAFHARMFVGSEPTYEDPATGSALAAFSGAIASFDDLREGTYTGWIEQGIEMGRPSRLRLELEMKGAQVAAARIGGHAVKAAEGVLLV